MDEEKGINPELERDVKATLRSIFEFTGTDMKYASYAQLIRWMEQLVIRRGGE